MEGKSEEEMLEAEYNLRSLMQVVWEISCRQDCMDPEDTLDFMGEFKDYKEDNDKSSSPHGSFEFEIKKGKPKTPKNHII